MFNLSVKTRQIFGKKAETLREKGILPAILYGPKTKNLALEVDLKEFKKIYEQAGESSLISLDIDNQKKCSVLIHSFERDPVSNEPIHVDFYQPLLDKEIEARIPLVFEGEPPAVRNLGGTLTKHLFEIEVKALPENLPKEIKVDVNGLRTFDDNVLVGDLKLTEGIKVLKEQDELVASISRPERVEEELGKPVEEKVEEAEKVGEEKKEEKEGVKGEKAEENEEEK